VPAQPTDRWPLPDDSHLLQEDTLVGGTPTVAPAPPPPDRRVGAGMLLALAVLLLVALGILGGWVLTHRATSSSTTVLVTTAPSTQSTTRAATATPKVAVPRLVGVKEQQAIIRLSKIGLRPKVILRQTKQPSNTVVSQKPKEANEVRRGTLVTLVVDSGAPKIVVPGLTGMKISEAQAKLDKLRLKASTTPVTSDRPAGTVVDQAPKAGDKLVKGSAVLLSVARAPKQTTTTTAATSTAASTTTTVQTTTAAAPPQPQNATMPNVQGQTEASAAQAMTQAGVLPSIVFVPSKDPLGTVEQQAKSSGTTVPYRAHVQINVSTGPGQKPQESVPNAIGRTLPDAVSAMQGAHLRLIYVKLSVTSRAQAGKIVQQSPLAGAHAPQNAQILVFVGAFRG